MTQLDMVYYIIQRNGLQTLCFFKKLRIFIHAFIKEPNAEAPSLNTHYTEQRHEYFTAMIISAACLRISPARKQTGIITEIWV